MSPFGVKDTDSFRPSGLSGLGMCGGLLCGLKRFIMSSDTSSRMLRHDLIAAAANAAALREERREVSAISDRWEKTQLKIKKSRL